MTEVQEGIKLPPRREVYPKEHGIETYTALSSTLHPHRPQHARFCRCVDCLSYFEED